MIFDKTRQDAPRLYWSADDIKLIKRRYGKKPLAEIAATLGRSEGAVRAQAFRLGLKLPKWPNVSPKRPPDIKPVRHRSTWTKKELNYVQAHYGKTPTREIAAKLARMQSAINMAAQALGLCSKQAQKWSQEEIAVLRTHYAEGAGVSCVLALLPGRSKSSIVVKASELGYTVPITGILMKSAFCVSFIRGWGPVWSKSCREEALMPSGTKPGYWGCAITS